MNHREVFDPVSTSRAKTRLLAGLLTGGLMVCPMFSQSTASTPPAATAQARVSLSVAEIVNKNIAARGGLEAWHKVQTMTWTGKMGAGGNQRGPAPVAKPGKQMANIPTDTRPKEEVQLPFVMDMARPRKQRFELQLKGKKAVQVYDGTNGWKLRPYLNRLEIEPYSADELRLASMATELDGPLVDYAAKGTKVELDGTEKVEDADTYKLKLTMKDGRVVHLWIDSKTFLETKTDGTPRRLDGIEHPVEVYFRDYRAVDGLKIPFLFETKVLPVVAPGKAVPASLGGGRYPVEKIALDTVQVNPKLDPALFTKPTVQQASLK